MNYFDIYTNIIEKARGEKRVKLPIGHPDRIYYENHHIWPNCWCVGELGYLKKDKRNLVLLTAREHFLAHYYLTKIEFDKHGHYQMLNAFGRMLNQKNKYQEREYIDIEELSDIYEETMKEWGKLHSEWVKENQSGENNPFYNHHHTEETKQILSIQKKGKKYIELYGEEKAKEMINDLSVSYIIKFGIKRAKEICKKLSIPYEEKYGIEEAEKIKNQISKSCTMWWTDDRKEEKSLDMIKYWDEQPERKETQSVKYTGKGNPFYDHHHTEKTKRMIGKANSGTLEERFDKEKAKRIRQILSMKKGENHWAHGTERLNMRGVNNYMFTGWFVTPNGIFSTIKEAINKFPHKISRDSITTYCHNSHKTITKTMVSQSSFLTKEDVGKTFKEIGFGFIPKEKGLD